MADEKTSTEVASLAGLIMTMTDEELAEYATKSAGNLRSLAASCLTQTMDQSDTEHER